MTQTSAAYEQKWKVRQDVLPVRYTQQAALIRKLMIEGVLRDGVQPEHRHKRPGCYDKQQPVAPIGCAFSTHDERGCAHPANRGIACLVGAGK
jgi:hypothetical protein